MTHTELAAEFIRAFNERDLDAFVATLHHGIEIHGMRGTRLGVDEAREWATRKPGGVQQRILVDEIRDLGNRVVALIRREWWWEDDDEMAGEDEMAWEFVFQDDLIRSWRPYDDREEALAER